MNCANHPDKAVAKYCRTCGKPLCTDCVREVMGIAYCEQCLAERVTGGTSAPSPYTAPAAPPVAQVSGPNPAIAGILAGFFPFGVGAVYCAQYAKGLAHLIVFVLLVVAQSSDVSGAAHTVLGFCIAGFWFYQLIDAVKSAKAMQVGLPAPDPFGLGSMFSPGDRPQDMARGVPIGAVVLIGLGVLFLLHNLGIWFLEVDRIWPVFLIALGIWLFAKRRSSAGYRNRSIVGPAVLVTIGTLSLIENLHGPGWDRTWPIILLVVGGLKLVERGHSGNNPYYPQQPPPGVPPEQQPEVNSEVKNG